MSEFEYYHAFETILYGLAIALLFNGAGKMYIHSKQVKFYWVHIIGLITILLTLTESYYSMFHIQGFYHKSYGTDSKWMFFLIKIVPTGVLYMAIQLLFPDNYNSSVDFKSFFVERERKFLSLIVIFTASLTVRNYLVFLPDHPGIIEMLDRQPFLVFILPVSCFTAISIAGLISKNHFFIVFLALIIGVYITWLMSVPPIMPTIS